MLAKSSLQPSSIPTYRRVWRLFYQFLNAIVHSVSKAFLIAPHTLALFIAYMYDKKYAHVSVLSYSHKCLGHPDPTKALLNYIIQILKGYGKIGSRLDSRLPITLQQNH